MVPPCSQPDHALCPAALYLQPIADFSSIPEAAAVSCMDEPGDHGLFDNRYHRSCCFFCCLICLYTYIYIYIIYIYITWQQRFVTIVGWVISPYSASGDCPLSQIVYNPSSRQMNVKLFLFLHHLHDFPFITIISCCILGNKRKT